MLGTCNHTVHSARQASRQQLHGRASGHGDKVPTRTAPTRLSKLSVSGMIYTTEHKLCCNTQCLILEKEHEFPRIPSKRAEAPGERRGMKKRIFTEDYCTNHHSHHGHNHTYTMQLSLHKESKSQNLPITQLLTCKFNRAVDHSIVDI